MSDYMKEAERLIAAHESAIRQHDRGAEWDEGPAKTLAALLAHIQRGAVPEALDPEFLIGYLEVREDWRGREFLIERIRQAAAPDQFRDATKMMAAPAGVSMPEADVTALWNYTDSAGEQHSLAYTHDQMRTYGAACHAAGEAAGYALGLKEAGRLISLWLKDPDVQRMLEFARDASRKVTSWPDRLTGEAEAER